MVVEESMSWLQVVVLSLLQGLTEFLPVSSSGHLSIFSKIFFGYDAGASFTAVVQLGTEAAVVVFFAKDIYRIAVAWFRGLANANARGDEYRLGWMVIIGTIPIGIIGFVFKDLIRDNARNLWITAIVLILFSFVFLAAERWGKQNREIDPKTLKGMDMKTTLAMAFAQCLALIPGVSRSGATMSAGMFMNLSREAAARYSFLLAIPAVLASGIFSLPDAFNPEAGQSASGIQIVIGVAIAFAVGYASIAWLLRFVQNHSLAWFAGYRIILGLVVIGLLSAGVITPTLTSA